jgi:hypothetical protein
MLGSDNSVDPEDVRDELMTELVLLNGALKKLDPDMDFSEVLRPLLADTGPAIAHAQRLGRQKIRMEKIRDDLVRKAEAEKMLPERSGSSTAAHDAVRPFPFGCYQEGQSAAPAEGTMTGLPARPFMAHPRPGPRTPVENIGYDDFLRQAEEENWRAAPSDRSSSSTPAHNFHVAPPFTSRPRPGPRAAQSRANIVPSEVLPAWGKLKRFSKRLDRGTYFESVLVAKWIFHLMLTQVGGPRNCRMRSLQGAMPEPPVARHRIPGFFSNRYLQFENIRDAALNNDFTQIQIAYYRNEELVAYRAAANKSRQSFIAWAVALLQMRGYEAAKPFSQDALLAAWNAIPTCERRSVSKANPASFFETRSGVRLTMEELFARAFPAATRAVRKRRAAAQPCERGSAAATRAARMGQHEPDALERLAVQPCRQQQVASEPRPESRLNQQPESPLRQL